MKKDFINKAISLWGLDAIEVEFLTQRENHMYKVTTTDGDYSFCIHRPGLRSQEEIESIIPWANMLVEKGLRISATIPSLTGAMSHTVDGIIVVVINWLSGFSLAVEDQWVELDNPADVYKKIGYGMAKMHALSDEWVPPKNFTRPVWGREGIIGDSPIWGKFWENHCLYFTDRSALLSVKHYANDVLKERHDELDFGMIHADLLPDNVILENNEISFINFSDAGFGYRLFDIATFLNRARQKDEYEEYRAAFLEGYRSKRPLDEQHLLLFQALRAFTYLGWIVPRLNEPFGSARCKMFIEEACDLAGEFLVAA